MAKPFLKNLLTVTGITADRFLGRLTISMDQTNGEGIFIIMNARLKLFFLANLSRQKIGSDRGFALPMALMVGMVILVVGVTMIIRAQSDQSKVISQVQTSQADAIAEAGTTRYMDFLNRHPVLLSAADHTKWSDQQDGV